VAATERSPEQKPGLRTPRRGTGGRVRASTPAGPASEVPVGVGDGVRIEVLPGVVDFTVRRTDADAQPLAGVRKVGDVIPPRGGTAVSGSGPGDPVRDLPGDGEEGEVDRREQRPRRVPTTPASREPRSAAMGRKRRFPDVTETATPTTTRTTPTTTKPTPAAGPQTRPARSADRREVRSATASARRVVTRGTTQR
jgi:hypothetical protein